MEPEGKFIGTWILSMLSSVVFCGLMILGVILIFVEGGQASNLVSRLPAGNIVLITFVTALLPGIGTFIFGMTGLLVTCGVSILMEIEKNVRGGLLGQEGHANASSPDAPNQSNVAAPS